MRKVSRFIMKPEEAGDFGRVASQLLLLPLFGRMLGCPGALTRLQDHNLNSLYIITYNITHAVIRVVMVPAYGPFFTRLSTSSHFARHVPSPNFDRCAVRMVKIYLVF